MQHHLIKDFHLVVLLGVVGRWWVGVESNNSPKEGFYRPSARTTDFTNPKLLVMYLVALSVISAAMSRENYALDVFFPLWMESVIDYVIFYF